MGLMTKSGSSKQRAENQLDPNTLAIQGIRKDELSRLIGATGGFRSIAQPRLDLATPQGAELNILSLLTGLPGRPLMREVETAGLADLDFASDPSESVRFARDLFERVAAPRVLSDTAAAGFGRSTAVPDALARAGAEIALPVSQAALNRRFQAGLARLGLGQTLESRELNRLGLALEAAGLPRRAAFEELVGRPQSLLTSMLTGIPVLTTPLSSTQRGEEYRDLLGDLLKGVLGGAATGAGAALMAGALCWVADALYGEGSVNAMAARYWVSVGWQGHLADAFRAVYRRIGPQVAALARRSRFVRRLLQPLFDGFVVRGLAALAMRSVNRWVV